jgi:hypothetical protein
MLRLILTATFLVTAVPALANNILRPQHPIELPQGTVQDVGVRIKGATVAYANYDLIRADFPAIAALDNSAIDRWVVENFAVLSAEQLKLSGIRMSMPETDSANSVQIHRPKDYQRAGVFEVRDQQQNIIGLVDQKGIGLPGVQVPGMYSGRILTVDDQLAIVERGKAAGQSSQTLEKLKNVDHSDGLMSEGEAIAELTRQQAIQAGFDIGKAKGGHDRETVETYWVIKLPFQILRSDNKSESAAICGRQAHLGRVNHNTRLSPADVFRDRVPQTTVDISTYVDFGNSEVTLPKLAKNFGMPETQNEWNAQNSNAWRWAHETAAANSRDAVSNHLREMLQPIEQEWSEAKQIKSKVLLDSPARQAADVKRRIAGYLKRNLPLPDHELSQLVDFAEKFIRTDFSELIPIAFSEISEADFIRLKEMAASRSSSLDVHISSEIRQSSILVPAWIWSEFRLPGFDFDHQLVLLNDMLHRDPKVVDKLISNFGTATDPLEKLAYAACVSRDPEIFKASGFDQVAQQFLKDSVGAYGRNGRIAKLALSQWGVKQVQPVSQNERLIDLFFLDMCQNPK